MTPPLTAEKEGPKPEAIRGDRRQGFVGRIFSKLGPGLITGASDDDPSGIATYSQVGAQFGYALLWTMLVSYPLMVAIQEICGRIGRVTGCGLAANLRKSYPKTLLFLVLLLMSAANVFNLGADIGAIGSSAALLIPGTATLFTIVFGVFSLLTVLFIPYTTSQGGKRCAHQCWLDFVCCCSGRWW
jgi:NRAMP (natural resistance-associated macrophage protein)-like metal ion transporter